MKEGALYIRIGSARTVQVAGPSEWEQLIELCVRGRQEEFLSRFSSLMEVIGMRPTAGMGEAPQADRTEALRALVKEGGVSVSQALVKHGLHPAYFEIAHIPDADHAWSQDELLEAMRRSKLHRTGWPIGLELHDDRRPKPTSRGVIASIYSDFMGLSYDYWVLDRDGGFYFARTYQEDYRGGGERGQILWFNTRIWRVAEAFEHAAALYRELGVPPTEIIHMHIRHTGLRRRELSASTPDRASSMRPREAAAEDEAVWSGTITQDQVKTQLKDLVRGVCDELFLLFDFFRLSEEVYDEVIGEYLSSQV